MSDQVKKLVIGGTFETRAKQLADDLVEWHAMTPQQQIDWRKRYPQRVNPEHRQRSLEMSRAMDKKMHEECKLPRTEPHFIGSGKTRIEVTGFYIK